MPSYDYKCTGCHEIASISFPTIGDYTERGNAQRCECGEPLARFYGTAPAIDRHVPGFYGVSRGISWQGGC